MAVIEEQDTFGTITSSRNSESFMQVCIMTKAHSRQNFAPKAIENLEL